MHRTSDWDVAVLADHELSRGERSTLKRVFAAEFVAPNLWLDSCRHRRILNPMPKAKLKKKPMTLDDFAMAIQKDYTSLHKDMANGFEVLRKDMKENTDTLRAEMGMGFRNIGADLQMITDAMVSKADLARTLADELARSPYTREISDLSARVTALEEKLGIKPTRRAA